MGRRLRLEPHRRYTGNVSPHPASAIERVIVGGSLQSRSAALVAAMRSAMRDLDSCLPVLIETWNQRLDLALFPWRVATVSLGVLGGMGAILSITGIFGMAAYLVSKRKRELGIRMAVGAQRKEVLKAALGRAFKFTRFRFGGRITPRNPGEPGFGFNRVSGNSARSHRVKRRCSSHVVVGTTGYLDSSAARDID
jgi:hypothetical protein